MVVVFAQRGVAAVVVLAAVAAVVAAAVLAVFGPTPMGAAQVDPIFRQPFFPRPSGKIKALLVGFASVFWGVLRREF